MLSDAVSRQAGEALRPTARQINVLRAYLEYGSYESAAEALSISPQTVRHHLGALRTRLAVHNNAQAVYVLGLTPLTP